jgi:phosphate transport system substrate-binding protein
MIRKLSIFVTICACLYLAACGSGPKAPADTLSKGTITVSADETFRPIIEEELKVFDSSYPDANITIQYKSEAECFRDFLNDTTRLILVTRNLLPEEKKLLEQKKVVPTSLAIAKDAVAVVLNNSSPDSVFSVSELRGILTGVFRKKYTVVFDNQGSSTVRYTVDSILNGGKLGANVYAAKGNDSVIAYVARNPDAIGFVGVSYVADYNDSEGLAFKKDVRVASVFNDSLKKFYGPYQAYIAPDYYPLTRTLFYIHRETYPGLGTGFANFMARDRGQLIFKQARLFPLRTNIIFREAAVNP